MVEKELANYKVELETKFKKSQMNNTYEFPRNKLPQSSQNSKTPTLKSSSTGVTVVPIEEPATEKQSASPASR
jgi:hypothetical protein